MVATAMGVLNLVVIVVILKIALAGISDVPAVLKGHIKDVKNAKAFTSLLKGIVNVNKERISAMHKLSMLQEYPLSPSSNRKTTAFSSESGEESDDYDSYNLLRILAYLMVPQDRPNTNRVQLCKHPKSKDDVRTRDQLVKDNLRSCSSENKKKCKKACRTAMRAACDEYDCDRRLRKKLKKKCKHTCKEEFEDYKD